jgi:hypothetical protein
MLLGADHEIGDCTAAIARQQPTNNNRGMVFSAPSMFVVRLVATFIGNVLKRQIQNLCQAVAVVPY